MEGCRRLVGISIALGSMVLGGCDEARDRAAADGAARAHAEEAGADVVFPKAPSPAVRKAVRGAALQVEEGEATFYADTFEGRRTASGRAFRQAEMVAAHRAFPFGTVLRVTNVRNGREADVRVVDRGPFGGEIAVDPVIDLSRAAAERLDFLGAGRTTVRLEVLEWGP